jgi:hypothetical protein
MDRDFRKIDRTIVSLQETPQGNQDSMSQNLRLKSEHESHLGLDTTKDLTDCQSHSDFELDFPQTGRHVNVLESHKWNQFVFSIVDWRFSGLCYACHD